MAGACATCGRAFSFTQRLKGRVQCDSCEAQARAALEQAVAAYPHALVEVARSATPVGPETDRLQSLERTIAEHGGDWRSVKDRFYRPFLDQALADEKLTAAEERQLDLIAESLFPTSQQNALMQIVREYRPQLFIARVNDGRLPVATESTVMLKHGEVLHLAESASLLKEVINREFQAGSRGVSFRIAKGVTYRVGATRGRMVEVGRSIVPADTGVMSVTSRRVVFSGERKSIEVPYGRLVDLNVYTDGIQFHISGRQNPPMFRVSSGPMIAAAVNAAAQRLEEAGIRAR